MTYKTDTCAKLLQFDHWANVRLYESMTQAEPLHERALFLFSHMVNTQILWLERILQQENTVGLFDQRPLKDNMVLLQENFTRWEKYLSLATDADITKAIRFYYPIDHSTREIVVEDGILHMTHHAAYHRGQIITLLKGSVDLPNVGFIALASKTIPHDQ